METYEKLDPEFKAKWVAALRSGEYEQGRGMLVNGDTYCCLGVACKVAGLSDTDFGEYCYASVPAMSFPDRLPHLFRESYVGSVPRRLANDNDAGMSFSEIADWIEANL